MNYYLVFSLLVFITFFPDQNSFAKSNAFHAPWGINENNSFNLQEKGGKVKEGKNVLAGKIRAQDLKRMNKKIDNCPVSGFWEESSLQSLKFFQILISPADGDRCPMFPSCSGYAVEAIKSFGFWRGAVLTSERLLRCGRETDYPLIYHKEQFRYYDPLEDNALWD